jgi:hypothetical protein
VTSGLIDSNLQRATASERRIDERQGTASPPNGLPPSRRSIRLIIAHLASMTSAQCATEVATTGLDDRVHLHRADRLDLSLVSERCPRWTGRGS